MQKTAFRMVWLAFLLGVALTPAPPPYFLRAGTLQESLFEMQMTLRKGIAVYQSLTTG